MSKHTKGPWEARNGEVTTQQMEGRSFRRIAAVQDYGMGSLPEVDDANARLIAAAPALLTACVQMHAAIDLLMAMLIECKPGFLPSQSGQPWEALLAGNAAIKKAEGSQP